MMKRITIILLTLLTLQSNGQTLLNADGPGNTYQLITSVLAPGHNPIETPDCSHSAFGDHIDEIFDNELNTNVFRFHIHVSPDDDRCINFDRQRNEIKTYDQSPDTLLGALNEIVIYKWRFKLESGFQSSPNFTHIHQLKSVGGTLESMPMYTLTTRKGSPDRLELRYAETNSQVTLKQTDLVPFIGTWVEVTETIEYATSGTYDIEIKRVSDNVSLFNYSNNNSINWRPGADFVRPKWGIYRSLINAQDLRDEEVRFANFSIEEVNVTSNSNISEQAQPIFSNPIKNNLQITNISANFKQIQLFSLDGKILMEELINSRSEVNLDVTSIPKALYILNLKGNQTNHSKVVLILQ